MLQLEWLGIHAFRFTWGERTILLDPYVSRDRTRLCDPDYVRRHIPKADDIVVSHSHWDHLADTPVLAKDTGATVIGSETTRNICASFGVASEQLIVAEPFTPIERDGYRVTFLPSLHMTRDGGEVPYAGTYTSPPATPPSRADEFLEGHTFAVLFEFPAARILSIGSANLIDEPLRDTRPDVLLLGIAGWETTPRFVERIAEVVVPLLIIPSHFDALEGPLERGVADRFPEATARFFRKMRECAPQARIQQLDYFEKMRLGEQGQEIQP